MSTVLPVLRAFLRQRWARYSVLALSALGLVLAVDAVWIEPARLVVNRQELRVPRWPRALSGLRVALISDLHVGSPHWDLARLRELVQRTNAEQPDLILLAGDYEINGVWFGSKVAIEPIAAELGKLRAPLGVVSVLGNHDWWNDPLRTKRALQANGVRVLDDEAQRIDARGSSFCLLGLRDEYFRAHSATQELDLALPGLPLIVLVHEPDVFAELDQRALLTLAGHTHGGQVDLPLLGRAIVPSRFGARYAAGAVIENGRMLFVTTGVGTSIIPVRFRVPPEIALLTLR
jgi:predicted MPP superfamily phosphohydrolase